MLSWTPRALLMVAAFTMPLLDLSSAWAQPVTGAAATLDCYDRLPTDPINLSLRDASTQATLRLLAQNYRVNLVVTDDVTGTVTLDFYRAPLRDVFRAIIDANSLVCVKQGELLRVSTADRLVKDERGRMDAVVASATRDLDVSRRINDLRKAEAESAISLAASEVTKKNAELIARRGEIKQEIIRIRYADAALVARTVAALVGIGPQVNLTPCRTKKTEDKLVIESIDAQGGGGASAQSEQERTAVNLARAASGVFGLQPPTPVTPAPGTSGPPGGLGALPPFSSLFGPPPPPVPVAPELVPGTGLGGFSQAETSPTVRTDCNTNSIALRLYDEQMRRAKDAIENQLDLLPPQVKIESRIELLDRSDLFALGVQWGGGGLLAVDSRTAVVGRGFTSVQTSTTGIGTSGFGSNQLNPNLPLTAVIPANPATGLGTAGNLVNLPIASLLDGAATSGTGGLAFGIVGSRLNLNLALEALRVQNRTQSLARPEVVVAENQKALVSLGEEIPYATVSAAGTQVQFKQAFLQLQVIPAVICRDEAQFAKTGGVHKMRLTVLVENNTRGAIVDLGGSGTPPAINTQKAQTEMMMLEGQRLVIGGVTQTTARQQDRKVPLLGEIPVLGWLFRQRGVNDTKRELVIFLTPTVLQKEAPTRAPLCPVPTALRIN